MMLQKNDQVKVIEGRYKGRAGKVIACPPNKRYSQLYVILPPDEGDMAFLADEYELLQVEAADETA